MTKVEELRLKLRISSRVSGVWADIDALIAAAHAEGAKEQKEQDNLCLMYEREGNKHEQKARVDFAHAEGVAEGEEQERERIRNELASYYLSEGTNTLYSASFADCFDDVMQPELREFCTVAACNCYVVPASVLAPKEASHGR